MSNVIRMMSVGALALVAIAFGTTANADPESVIEPGKDAGLAALRLNPLGVTPLRESALATKRGGTDSVSSMKLKGVVADNRAVNTTTGNNSIADGAFSGAAGLPMVIQNTGNNVLIQNATIVNVQIH